MKKIIRQSVLLLACLLVLFIFAGAALYFHSRTTFDLETLHYKLILPPGYDAMDGMKIVFFSDLHMLDTAGEQQKIRNIIRRINVERPDLILFGGDLIATKNLEKHLFPSRIISRMRRLKAKYGVFAVTGNHDWIGKAGKHLTEKLEQSGIRVLDNSAVNIPGKCCIAGVQDENGPEGCLPQETMKNADPALPVIVLMHRPEYHALFPGKVRLFFAGHTHGGQINLPLLKDFLLRCIHEEKYGEHVCLLPGGRKLFISFGIGTSWLRVRINCPSDIMIFTCRSVKHEKRTE